MALDTAVISLGITKGDEVIMPTFTIISCASAITRVGAIPVLIDADIDTWNMDVSKVEEKITSKTKAIMVVHIYGLPVDMDKIEELAQKYDLKIIEDAAEEIGQQYRGKPIGCFGDISCFSFYPNKHITTGEGGMILTDDEELADKCRSLRNLCFIPSKRFFHETLGFNYRMTNIQAALGVAQLERLDEFINIKRQIGEVYNTKLKNKEFIQIPVEKMDYSMNIYWVFGIVLKESIKYNADEAMFLLGKHGIGTRPFFYPMHLQPVFKKMGLFKNESYPVSERLAKKGFYIPSGLALEESDINKVCNSIIELFS